MLELVLRAALALLFASAAWHKLRDLAGVPRGAARLSPAAAPSLVPVAAPALAGAELAVAVGAAGAGAGARRRRCGALALLALYAVAIAVNLARGRRDDRLRLRRPGARQPLSEWLLARNALLVAAALSALGRAAPRPLGLGRRAHARRRARGRGAASGRAAHGLAARVAPARASGARR